MKIEHRRGKESQPIVDADGNIVAPSPFGEEILFDSPHETMRDTLEAAVSDSTDLRGAFLIDHDLSGAKLAGADLVSANLFCANLEGADMSGADLAYADMVGANLRGVNLQGAVLSGTNLRSADLTGANLKGAMFHPGWKIVADKR